MIIVKKRDGRKVDFNQEKIFTAILKAASEVGRTDTALTRKITNLVVDQINEKIDGKKSISVEEIQDIVERTLVHQKHYKTAKAYIIYRFQHQNIREVKDLFSNVDMVDKYIEMRDWRINENANMSYSLQGLNFHVASLISKEYWMKKVYPSKIRDAHKSGDLHIHDLGSISTYCVGWDLQDLLLTGFKGVAGKIECKPAKHLRTALGQIVNFFYTLQGESAGAQAFSNFDTLLSPFIRYDDLSFKELKQVLQEFIFNMNVPTRVGFQCMSEDTEILTPLGWASYDELSKGDDILTFNTEKQIIEKKQIKKLFKRHYSGKMFNLKNRIQDQLISPKHRIVRKKFNSNNYILEEVEETKKLKSPFIIPIAATNGNKGLNLDNDLIKLLAWVIAEGSSENPGFKQRQSGRITIYQSKIKNNSNYKEIISLLKKFRLEYSERDSTPAMGSSTKMIRLNATSSKSIHSYFDDNFDIKHIPKKLMLMNTEQARIFLSTYLQADGFEDCKIATTSKSILDGIQQICVLAEYGFTVLERKPTIGTKNISVLRIIKHKNTYIQKIKEVNYSGVIWCPNTDNETVIARRNGKVFITGNTPFTNITMDFQIPNFLKKEAVIIGGKPQDKTYGDFKKEIIMFNQAFAEVMGEGDAKGRVFTFPIPTYSITNDFEWDNKDYDEVWKITAKYGIPYFSNFVSSDMNPEDVRSMCCRLRLDNRELKKRGGGLFGANPLTGSIGVVTINLPRLGLISKNEEEFFNKLDNLLELAKQSLEIKRKTLEHFSDKGLYPYSMFYLRGVKKVFNEYWKNHFSTIGVIGMNEASVNLLGESIGEEKGNKFAEKVLDYIRNRLLEFQEETGNLFNLEATPAEGTTYRLAKIDQKTLKTTVFANSERVKEGAEPYYTNSSLLPVNFTEDLFESLDLQDGLQTKYTGGTVYHIFLGEKNPTPEAVKNLIKKACLNYKIPYFTITPTFSVCPVHGYIYGEHQTCPKCEAMGKHNECEVYSRVVGYLRPVQQWNKGKKEEFLQRSLFDKALN